MQAFNAAFVKVAPNATATSTSTPPGPYGSYAALVNDGFTDGNYYGANPILHSNTSDNSTEWVKLTFSTAVELSSFTIFGRTDNNGQIRDSYLVRFKDIDENALNTSSVDATLGTPVNTVLSPIPEPSEWAMMLAGLAVVGFVDFKRRNRQIN